MKTLRSFMRLLLGLTLLISGFVKIIDPIGGGLVLSEYFKAFHLNFMLFSSIPVGATLAGLEMILGISLLFGLRMKITTTISFILVTIFTLLTLVLAIFNPVTDCGCFGEALKLTNWETFYKNIVLFIAAAVLYFQRNNFTAIAPFLWEWIFVGVYLIGIIALSIYSYRHLPMIDFLDFKSGTELYDDIDKQNFNEKPIYETMLIYTKDGKRKEFKIDQLPDSSWTFVDSKTSKISDESASSKTIFAVSDRYGNYVTDSLLKIKGPTFIVSVPYIEKLSKRALLKIKELNDTMVKKSINFYLLTGSSLYSTDSILKVNSLQIKYYSVDYKTLISLNRSNGGVVYINDATIIEKWSMIDSPIKNVDKIVSDDPELISAKANIREHLAVEIAIFAILMLIIFMRFICKFIFISKIVHYADIREEESSK